ncbi:MAG TPA: hypothetical protein DCR27_00110 [Lachnospiraceae bacterium]|nr:hypothetical protein [Lachnospiraceae bacterium]
MKKKLLITASTFPRWEADTEPRFILDLSKALQKYYDVTVLVPAAVGAKRREVLEGVSVIRYHYFPVYRWETLCYPGAIVPRIREKKVRICLVPFLFLGLFCKMLKIGKDYDIVFANWLIPQGIVQSFFKIPYVLVGHGGDVSSLNKAVVKQLKVRACKKAGKVIVVSKELKNQLKKYFNSSPIDVIPMGCDIKKFNPLNRVHNYFGQKDKKIVLFVGRLAEKKGIEYLIEAAGDIDARFIIVGEGPLREKLIGQASGLADKLVFCGAKPHEELAKIYASADIFVAPSVTAKDGDKEGMPTTIMEAMASGIPVVASNSGGISEILKDGENGFLVAERDVAGLREKINMLVGNAELRKKLGKNARLTAEEYDYTNIARKYADAFRCLLPEN